MGRKKSRYPCYRPRMPAMSPTGYVHNPPCFFVLDDNGNFIRRENRKPPPPSPSRQPTSEDLALLEDSIYKHYDYQGTIHSWFRAEFHKQLNLVEKAQPWGKPWDAEAQMKEITLRHCWEELFWRPLENYPFVTVEFPPRRY